MFALVAEQSWTKGGKVKSLRLECHKCGKTRTFYGRGVTEILSKIDDSGWRDMPPEEHRDLCPKCNKESDRTYEEGT